MRRELHVRFCEGGGARLPSATRLIYSLALGTGLRLAEIVGLNVGDVFFPKGKPRNRVRIRAEIAKGGRAGDIFLPDKLAGKLRKFWAHKLRRRERTDLAAEARL